MMRLSTVVFVVIGCLIVSGAFLGCGGEKSVDELRALGKKAFLDQDYKEARQYFLEAISEAPSDRELLFLTGMSYKRDFLLDSALFYLKKVDLLFPDDRETHEQLYELAVALKDWDTALAALGGLVRTGDNIEDHYDEYAEFWAKSDHPGNAYFYITKAIDVDPENPQLYIQAGNLASAVDSGQRAIEWLDSAIERFGENDAFFSTKAMLLAREGRFVEAERLYRILLSRDTSYVASKINLANVLASQDSRPKKQEALILYRNIRETASEQMLIDFKIDSMIAVVQEEIK